MEKMWDVTSYSFSVIAGGQGIRKIEREDRGVSFHFLGRNTAATATEHYFFS